MTRSRGIRVAGLLVLLGLAFAGCAAEDRPPAPTPRAEGSTRLVDVAQEVGLDFRHGAFARGPAPDVVAMMGTGVCWLDADRNGWLDLFVVNSYVEAETALWNEAGGLPRSALYRNDGGRFREVGEETGTALALRGTGCVAADLDVDGDTDLYVTTARENVLLWNRGDGTFVEGTRAAGVSGFGWSAAATVGDVDGNGLPDLFVAGYTDLNNPVPGARTGFPGTFLGVRDLLYLNEGRGRDGVTFREVGVEAGLEVTAVAHGLGAVFTDVEGDGDLDLYVANDTDPNRLYRNVRWPGGVAADPAGLGFRFEELAASAGVADPNAGMGVAGADYDGDGRGDLFVSNLRGQGHAVYRAGGESSVPSFADERFLFGPDPTTSSGWGASWADLDLDTDLDLVLVSGQVPVRDLARDAQAPQVFENLAAQGEPGSFSDADAGFGVDALGRLNARGSAAADFDNDGDLDVAVAVVGGRLLLLENRGHGGAWLEVELGRFAPGARVTVELPDGRRLVREAQAGASYLSSEDPRLHFGLGAAERVRVEVRWPGGETTVLPDVRANRVLRVEAPTPSALRRLLPSRGAGAGAGDHRVPGCSRDAADTHSVARVWDEALLDAIRRDFPAPTVHARNLFHVSAAMWDAWAAYDDVADGVFVDERHAADDVAAARETAISYAAFRVLLHRYALAAGAQETVDQLVATLEGLCFRADYVATGGDSPAALGNRIAAAVLAHGRADGAREDLRYGDPEYRSANDPLVVADPGATLRDPNRWQPLALAVQIAQNGLPLPAQVQRFVGSHWGRVTPFALTPSPVGLPLDPGPPPALGDAGDDREYRQAALDVLRFSSLLDPADGVTIDVGPGARGNNPLGTNAGRGHRVNPATGEPYEPTRVLRADFARVVAEFWADGPQSETPPGHWNTIANTVSDALALRGRLVRDDVEVDRLEWDVHLYLALNGALHDAAIAAWGAKGHYDSVRPISMIRWLGGRGQASAPEQPSYDRRGLPLVPGLVELVTAASSAPGGRHAHLADHVGEVAVRAWRGNPADPETEVSGVGWIRAVEWVPYQRPTFVTPAFAGYVSGHSTFSRAAAEVLTAFTGDPFFPGGELRWTVGSGTLLHEEGPTQDVTLRWATYADAADEAGISRLYGGIHVVADDLAGRRLGAEVGTNAWARALRFFDGSARP